MSDPDITHDALYAQDQLERAAATDDLLHLKEIWESWQGEFALPGYALALALRKGARSTAAFLLDQGVSIMGTLHRPSYHVGKFASDDKFTRFGLTEKAPTLFVHNMDRTITSEVFDPHSSYKPLGQETIDTTIDVQTTTDLVFELASTGRFSPLVFDDLVRVAAVSAWHCLRHSYDQDIERAHIYLAFVEKMLVLWHKGQAGDARLHHILANLIVPRAHAEIICFVAKNSAEDFFARYMSETWLQSDTALMESLLSHFTHIPRSALRILLVNFAEQGNISAVQELLAIEYAPEEFLRDALSAAANAGQSELSLWLYSYITADKKPNEPRVYIKHELPQSDMKPTVEEDDPELDALARDIVALTQQELISRLPYLARSISLLEPATYTAKTRKFHIFATDGTTLFYQVRELVDFVGKHKKLPLLTLCHSLIHCLMLHPFVGTQIEARRWSFAADVEAELISHELLSLPFTSQEEEQLLADINRELQGKCSAEKVMRLLKDKPSFVADDYYDLVFCDDHMPWYIHSAESVDQNSVKQKDQDALSKAEQAGAQSSDAQPNKQQDTKQSNSQSDSAQDASDTQEQEGKDSPATSSASRASAQDIWKDEAKRLCQELSSAAHSIGQKSPTLMRRLAVSAHDERDFREFLRQFASVSEEIKVSDNEFDYIFYTYGLELYHDMPLIEPLEYRSEKKIRDFVIVLDTSSSVIAPVVQEFVDTVYDVLMSEGSFFTNINVHIIQCDMNVQSDFKIRSLHDLNVWRKDIKLQGFGGTDFRPAFRYVDKLILEGEFSDLAGLLYFTDGWGVYPERMPGYRSAFIFFDEDHRPDLVPAWAEQITLHPGQFQSLSVYH